MRGIDVMLGEEVRRRVDERGQQDGGPGAGLALDSGEDDSAQRRLFDECDGHTAAQRPADQFGDLRAVQSRQLVPVTQAQGGHGGDYG